MEVKFGAVFWFNGWQVNRRPVVSVAGATFVAKIWAMDGLTFESLDDMTTAEKARVEWGEKFFFWAIPKHSRIQMVVKRRLMAYIEENARLIIDPLAKKRQWGSQQLPAIMADFVGWLRGRQYDGDLGKWADDVPLKQFNIDLVVQYKIRADNEYALLVQARRPVYRAWVERHVKELRHE
jgi:hypothetical protein